jgi:endogenous inhibitor of DNA gyrase (YacG/DUF329 family)
MATAGAGAKSSKCPICEKAVAARAANPKFPFCSERCRMADLGRWLNEEYRIPVQEPEDEGEDGGAAGAAGETSAAVDDES